MENRERIEDSGAPDLDPVAIVGIACRLPGGVRSPSMLWDFLSNGKSGHGEVPATRFNALGFVHSVASKENGERYRPRGYFLQEDVRNFDPDFFGILHTEALHMDPQQRKLLEIVYECFESAGIRLDQVSGSNTGCYVGNFTYDYPIMQSRDPESFSRFSATGLGITILSNRISHTFNLKGPSLVIDTACSSSLYCLHSACTAIQNGDCDAAIVASANLIQSVEQYMAMEKAGVLSPESMCHTFSDSANGYGRAEGIGALYLKKLSIAIRDNDPIRAVIRGSAVGSNGKTSGISAPDIVAQANLIRKAYKRAGVDESATSYIECHGTGTSAGDPAEVEALARVFPRDYQHPLFIGSIKPNIGHGEGVSGLSSIIKMVLALEARQIPPTINVGRVNPKIKTEEWGLNIVKRNRDWESLPSQGMPQSLLRAGINSFGYGGANAHVIIENADTWDEPLPRTHNPSKWVLLPFSATNFEALEQRYQDFRNLDLQSFDLADLAYTLGCRRTHFACRSYVVLRHNEINSAPQVLCTPRKATNSISTPSSSLTFVFTGQGAQWAGMARELLKEYPEFLQSIRKLDNVLRQLPHAPSWSIEDVILDISVTSAINEAAVAQPVVTAIQVAMTELLYSWSIRPKVVIGHSSGEIAAAFAAGHISADDAMVAAYYRGYVNALNSINGAMLAVGLSREQAATEIDALQLGNSIQVGCINSPENVTVTGDHVSIHVLASKLHSRGIFARELKTGGKAYHSHHMLALGPKLEELLLPYLRQSPTPTSSIQNVRFLSTVTGDFKNASFDSKYWRINMESPVLFSDAIQRLLLDGETHLVEVGPHSALELPLKQIYTSCGFKQNQIPYSTMLSRGKNAAESALNLVGSLYSHGLQIPFEKISSEAISGQARVVADLPPYPWSYKKLLWKEPRASLQLRTRKHPRHELLGSIQATGDDHTLQWRNILRLRDVPWLEGHKLEGSVIFPGAGYITMAGEAAFQASNLLVPVSETEIRQERVAIRSALVIANEDIELFTTLRANKQVPGIHTLKSWEFEITSFQSGSISVHCTGTVNVSTNNSTLGKLGTMESSNLRPQSVRACYRKLAERGLDFGVDFQSLMDIQSGSITSKAHTGCALSYLLPKAVRNQDSFLHPIALDALFQTGIISDSAGLVSQIKGMVPTFIQSIVIAGDLVLPASTPCEIVAHSEKNENATTITAELRINNLVVTKMLAVQMTPYTPSLSAVTTRSRQLVSKISWEPALLFSSLSGDDVSEYMDLALSQSHDMGKLDEESSSTGQILSFNAELNSTTVHSTTIVLEADGAGTSSKALVSYIINVLGHPITQLNLSEVRSFTFSRTATVISLLEIERPMLRVIDEMQLNCLKIITDQVSRIIWVTAGDFLEATLPDFSLAAGLARSLMAEQPDLRFFTLDIPEREVGRMRTARNITSILKQNDSVSTEFEFIQNDNILYVSRFTQNIEANERFNERHNQVSRLIPLNEAKPCGLDSSFYRHSSSAGLRPVFSKQVDRKAEVPSPGYVEVEALVFGISSHALLPVRDATSFENSPLFADFSGVVSHVGDGVSGLTRGDYVIGMAPCHLQTHLTVPAWACAKISPSSDLQRISSLPYIYSTVLYALKYKAQLEAGESILIKGLGAVGYAAIQVSRLLGAQIFVVVNDEAEEGRVLAKTDLARSDVLIVGGSFVARLQSLTGGGGVAVFLNATDSQLPFGIEDVCGAFSRVVDLSNSISSFPLSKQGSSLRNVTLYTIQLSELFYVSNPRIQKQWSGLLKEVIGFYNDGLLKKHPETHCYDILDFSNAFRASLANSEAYVTVSLESPDSLIDVRTPAARAAFAPSKTYIIVGGTGGIGSSIAEWMLTRGARKILLFGMSGHEGRSVRYLMAKAASYKASVKAIRCDITSSRDVDRVIGSDDLDGIGGIVHCAMGLSEKLFTQMSAESWHTGISAKVNGAWNIHNVLHAHGKAVDFFLLISSVSGSIGPVGQTNYSAANHFLDTFARYRQKLGLPAMSIALGMISDIGYLAQNPEVRDNLARTGISALDEEEMLQIIEMALTASSNELIISTRSESTASEPGVATRSESSIGEHSDPLYDFSASHLLTGLENVSRPDFGTSFPLNNVARDSRTRLLLVPMTSAADQGPSPHEQKEKLLKDVLAALSSGLALGEAVGNSVRSGVARIISLEPEALDTSKPLTDYGIDSMIATEVRMWLFETFSVNVSLFDVLSSVKSVDDLIGVVVDMVSKAEEGLDNS